MDLAAFAALRQPLEVEIGGLLYDVDPPSLQEWAAAFTEPIPLLPLLPYSQAQRLSRRLRDQEVDLVEVTAAWQDVLESSADFPWYVTVVLLRSLIDSWAAFAGALGKRGVDALTMPLDQAVATMWQLLLDSAGGDLERERLRAQLWAPPAEPGRKPPPMWTDEDEGAAWLKAAASTPNVPGVRVSAG